MKLLKFTDERWALVSGSVWSLGSIELVSSMMVSDLGIDPEQIRVAVTDMQEKNNNVADFGLWGTFIASSRQYVSAC